MTETNDCLYMLIWPELDEWFNDPKVAEELTIIAHMLAPEPEPSLVRIRWTDKDT